MNFSPDYVCSSSSQNKTEKYVILLFNIMKR